MKFKNYLLSILLIIISSTIALATTNSYENFDTSLVQGIEYSYQEPKKILFTQIEGRQDTLALSVEEYLDTLYYYSITKLKLGNIPYHYVLDESGNVYKTQANDAIKVIDESYIVIGYLSNNGQLPNKAGSALLELTEDISYKYGLQEYDVKSYSLIELEDSFSQLTLSTPSDLFSSSIDSLLSDWEGYDREHLEYIATIENVEHAESVVIGNTLEVKVTVKNENNFAWTSDRYPMYISVKDSQDSKFSVNEIWESFSKPVRIDSQEFVLPGETVELQFELYPRVKPGEYSESFELLKFQDEPIKGSEFKVEFKVEKGEQDIVLINSPEFGFVNMRECRRFSCEKIDIVNDGEVYPVVEYHESCWYKIKFEVDKEGWFYCPYAQEIE
jgi:hypothetical protein